MMEEVFWRMKGDEGGSFHDGLIRERNGKMVLISESHFSEGDWYKADELEIVVRTNQE
jgi:hypothetical protein